MLPVPTLVAHTFPMYIWFLVEHDWVCLFCFSYLPLDSAIDSVIDSVTDLVSLSYVYIEALVPYRINRVLILHCQFNISFLHSLNRQSLPYLLICIGPTSTTSSYQWERVKLLLARDIREHESIAKTIKNYLTMQVFRRR